MRRIFVSCSGIALAMSVAQLTIGTPPLGAQSPGTAASANTRADSLTLADAQARARRASPQLAAARAAVAAAAGLERQARSISNPSLSFQREATSGSGQKNSQNITTIDQPLDLAVRGARTTAATRRREATEARLLDAQAQLDLDVARAYAQVMAAERRAALAAEAATVFARARRVSDERLAAGDISGYANRRIRLEAARYAALGAEATLAAQSARLTLASLLSPDDGRATFSLAMPATSAQSASAAVTSESAAQHSVDSLVALALTQRGDLRAARLDEATAEAESRVAARSRIPVPVLTAGLKTEQISGVGDLSGFAAGVVIPLPLWDRRGGAVAASTADLQRATAHSELVKRRVVMEVQQASAALLAIDVQLRALTPELGAVASAALRSAEVAYAEGEVSLLEWLDAVRAYQEAESAFAALQSESLIRRAALDRAVGSTVKGQVP